IHYIWSPTVLTTWKCNYFSKYKLLNNFSHQKALVEAYRRSFLSTLGGCESPDPLSGHTIGPVLITL
ncbi:unnamed protein product, partial [Staurois parvus]